MAARRLLACFSYNLRPTAYSLFTMPLRLLLIFLAGGLGSGTRYLVSSWALQRLGTGFPYGTFAVNVIGSFLISLVIPLTASRELVSPTLRLTLTAGFLGGFTTYSAFNYESLQYLEKGAAGLFALYVGATLLACLAAGALGLWAGRWLATL